MQYEIIIIILLVVVALIIYFYFTDFNVKIHNLKNEIVNKVEEQLCDIGDKLNEIDETFNKKIFECNKRVNEIYSFQNKVNEISRINSQLYQKQFTQYNEEYNDDDIEYVLNSMENSCSPKININNKIFVQKKSNDLSNLYMSDRVNIISDNNSKNIMSNKINKRYEILKNF